MLKIQKKDLKGREVIPYSLPGVGTKLVINGNEFQIIYTKRKGTSFTAELIGKYEDKKAV